MRAPAFGAGGAGFGGFRFCVSVDASFFHVVKVVVLYRCHDVQGLADELVYGGLAVGGEGLADAVGDDGAEAETGVSEQFAETIDTGRFHLEIGDAIGAIGEAGEPVDQFRLGEAEAQDAALWAIKAGAGDGNALVEAGGEVAQQGGAGAADIGLCQAVVELRLGGKVLEELVLFFRGVVAVEVEEVVDAQAVGGGDIVVYGYVVLQGAASADADNGEGGEGLPDGAGGKVDIRQGVELVEDDVDVIGADAGGDDGEPFFADAAGMGYEFAVVGAVFDGVEVSADPVHAVGVAHGDDGRGQFFGPEVEVIDGSAFIDN